jgi:predicted MPP superfamily phosphohydrolase
MHPAELFRVLLFLGSLATVYLLAASTIVRALARRLRRPLAGLPRGEVWVRRVAMVLAAAGLPCFYYGWRIEPYWPEVTRVALATDKLPAGDLPIRIAHLSDLHSERRERLEPRLPPLVQALNPDLIVFTGDAVNALDGLPTFRRCLRKLAAIAPTFAVRGNWDVWYFPRADPFEGTGARELDGEARPVRLHDGRTLFLAGVAVGHESRLERTLSALPPHELSLFLYHSPDLIKSVRQSPVDLYCAGHTHGGQVALPLYGALVTFSRYGKKYESGLFHVGTTTMYVNRGIGMEGGLAPRVRFWARPEITLYEISPATDLAHSSRTGSGGVTAATSSSPVRMR